MSPLFLVIIFIVATFVGYKLISNVPSLLHTPLMSSMNALAAIPILAAITAVGIATSTGSTLAGAFAIFLAMVNIVGGYGVTVRMLKMFSSANKKK